MVPDSGVTCQLLPAAEAYCTLHPLRSTGSVPGLNSSMKSFLRVAPELPPPPYTWLIPTWGAELRAEKSALTAATFPWGDRVDVGVSLHERIPTPRRRASALRAASSRMSVLVTVELVRSRRTAL